MKPISPARFLVTTFAILGGASWLSVGAAPPARAMEPMTKQAQVAQLMKDPETARMALHEMMKSRANKQMMAKELARDREFRSFYTAEVGTNAPHQERNPSAHPELFERRKKS